MYIPQRQPGTLSSQTSKGESSCPDFSPPLAPPRSAPDGSYILTVCLVCLLAVLCSIVAVSLKWLRERRVKLEQTSRVFGSERSKASWSEHTKEKEPLLPGSHSQKLKPNSRFCGATSPYTEIYFFPSQRPSGSVTSNCLYTDEEIAFLTEFIMSVYREDYDHLSIDQRKLLTLKESYRGRVLYISLDEPEKAQRLLRLGFQGLTPVLQENSESGSGSGTTQAI